MQQTTKNDKFKMTRHGCLRESSTIRINARNMVERFEWYWIPLSQVTGPLLIVEGDSSSSSDVVDLACDKSHRLGQKSQQILNFQQKKDDGPCA